MKIVDAQVHLWGTNTPQRPWPPARPDMKPQLERAFELGDLLAETRAAGVDRAIIVPPSWEGCRNDLGLAAAKQYPDRFAVMGRFELADPASRGMVAGWKQQPGMLGMRITFHSETQKPWLTDGTADWLWPAAEKAGIPIMVLVPGNLPPLKKIAERHPGLKLVVDHMAIGRGLSGDAAFAHLDELNSLAKLPNVAVKITTLPIYSDEPYPHPKLHQHVRRMYDAYGPKRLFWGSDVTRLPCSYRLCVTLLTEEIKWLSSSDLEWIMGRGVCEWLDWPL
jgi:L-fuconolactonase